jgi:hypothetical protein
MHKTKLFSLLFLTTLLSSCFSGTTEYEGLSFPKTTASEITFQEHSVPADCSAFAHLLMNTKMHSSGKDISVAMHQEAEEKGANLILVGMSREMIDEELAENRFDYYGPQYAYTFDKTWLGWKFGFDEWNDAGNLVGLGAYIWGNSDISFDNTLLIQAVFLRCGQGR